VRVLTVTDPSTSTGPCHIVLQAPAHPSPVPDSPTIHDSLWRYYLKETLGVGVGRIVGYGD